MASNAEGVAEMTTPPLWVQRLFWNVHSWNWDSGSNSTLVTNTIEWAETHVPPGGSVLDLGCGTGLHSLALARNGYEVLGLDFAAGMIDRATKKAQRDGLSARFRIADLNAPLSLPSGSFAGALSISVLQCIAEPTAFLREVRRVLPIGGSFLLGVKATPGSISNRTSARHPTWFDPLKRRASRAAYLHRFTGSGLGDLLASASFGVLSERQHDGWLWVVARAR